MLSSKQVSFSAVQLQSSDRSAHLTRTENSKPLEAPLSLRQLNPMIYRGVREAPPSSNEDFEL